MREYQDDTQLELTKLFCNCCGREIKVVDHIIMEGCFHVDYPWGYFSEKDGLIHSFDLCENCYDKMISGFQIPPAEAEAKEFL